MLSRCVLFFPKTTELCLPSICNTVCRDPVYLNLKCQAECQVVTVGKEGDAMFNLKSNQIAIVTDHHHRRALGQYRHLSQIPLQKILLPT